MYKNQLNNCARVLWPMGLSFRNTFSVRYIKVWQFFFNDNQYISYTLLHFHPNRYQNISYSSLTGREQHSTRTKYYIAATHSFISGAPVQQSFDNFLNEISMYIYWFLVLIHLLINIQSWNPSHIFFNKYVLMIWVHLDHFMLLTGMYCIKKKLVGFGFGFCFLGGFCSQNVIYINVFRFI